MSVVIGVIGLSMEFQINKQIDYKGQQFHNEIRRAGPDFFFF